MIERVEVADIVALADHETIRAAMPGLSLDARLRALGRCLWLRAGNDFAVIEPKWLGSYRAVVFNADEDKPFVRAVFDYVFNEPDAKSIQFSTRVHGVGEKYRARFIGAHMVGGGFLWELQKHEYAIFKDEHRDSRSGRRRNSRRDDRSILASPSPGH